MERLTHKNLTKACNDPWDYCGLDSVCKRDCHKPTPCKLPKIVHRLAEIEDILGDDYNLDRLRELTEAVRAKRCFALPVLPALCPGITSSEVFILLDSGEIVTDTVGNILIAPDDSGDIRMMFDTFDNGYFDDDDVGKRIFWKIEDAQKAAAALKDKGDDT